MSSTLIAHCDTTVRTRDQLRELHTPERTKSWLPIPHYDLVSQIAVSLGDRGIAISREQFSVGGADDCLMYGIMDLAIPGFESSHVSPSVGFRTANNRKHRLEIIAAGSVFVCDNRCFSGYDGAVFVKRKHTSGLDVAELVPPAIDLYLDKVGVWKADIDHMRECSLSDGRAKGMIYDAFVTRPRNVLPMHLLADVHRLYFDDEIQRDKFASRSLWSLNNAFTESVKKLDAIGQNRYGREIGTYFGEILHDVPARQVALRTWLDRSSV
jgi:hypothetical protein